MGGRPRKYQSGGRPRSGTRSTHVGHCPATGKAQFTSKKEARQTARRYAGTERPFLCMVCTFWHLGHVDGIPREQHREWSVQKREREQ